jgi:hypothetical protein
VAVRAVFFDSDLRDRGLTVGVVGNTGRSAEVLFGRLGAEVVGSSGPWPEAARAHARIDSLDELAAVLHV